MPLDKYTKTVKVEKDLFPLGLNMKVLFKLGMPLIGIGAIISKSAWIITMNPLWLSAFLILIAVFLLLWIGFRIVYGQWYPDPFFETSFHKSPYSKLESVN